MHMTKYVQHINARPELSLKSFIIGHPPYKVAPPTGPQKTGWAMRA